ncbi:MAG: adenylyltransferase/cytidyltransferase family protein [Anaerolineae bacterium]
MKRVAVAGSFDDLRSSHVRFLHEASRHGELWVWLWSDAVAAAVDGRPPKFPEPERRYMLEAIRYVDRLVPVVQQADPDALPQVDTWEPDIWMVPHAEDSVAKRAFCASAGIEYVVVPDDRLVGFPVPAVKRWERPTPRKKVIVTGCYDWLHSGHVRFFEEAAELGDVYVAVGNDESVRHLKEEGHPLLGEAERLYMVQSIRYVTQAVLTKGIGWMDAAPNVAEIRPDIYVVNEDGDKPEKRAFCAERGLEYVVLKRKPKEGLSPRSSTRLRGF